MCCINVESADWSLHNPLLLYVVSAAVSACDVAAAALPLSCTVSTNVHRYIFKASPAIALMNQLIFCDRINIIFRIDNNPTLALLCIELCSFCGYPSVH